MIEVSNKMGLRGKNNYLNDISMANREKEDLEEKVRQCTQRLREKMMKMI